VSSSSRRAILYGGCNVQFATFTLDGNALSFSGVIGTKKACQVDKDSSITTPMFEESKYLEIVNSQLVFYDKDLKQKVVYTSAPPP
jgi:heat shock protein HslJ